MATLHQLYGYKTEKEFRKQFNKNMSGGVKQFGPPPTTSITRSRRVAYKTRGAAARAASGFGAGSPSMKYPVKVYSKLTHSLGNQIFK